MEYSYFDLASRKYVTLRSQELPVRVGKGKKSMAFSLTYRADDHTLTSEEVEKTHAKLVNKVMRSTGGEVRS